MIEKWYCLRCDTCGELINYWREDSVKDAIERERNNGDGERAIALRDGRCFCCEDCYETWGRIRGERQRKWTNYTCRKRR